MATKSHKQKVADFLNRNDHINDMVLSNPKQHGIWRINGEATNCDMRGPHIMPYLETVSGSIIDVVNYAVELPHFWAWGAGGGITEIIIKPVIAYSIRQRLETEDKIKALEAEVAKLKQTL